VGDLGVDADADPGTGGCEISSMVCNFSMLDKQNIDPTTGFFVIVTKCPASHCDAFDRHRSQLLRDESRFRGQTRSSRQCGRKPFRKRQKAGPQPWWPFQEIASATNKFHKGPAGQRKCTPECSKKN